MRAEKKSLAYRFMIGLSVPTAPYFWVWEAVRGDHAPDELRRVYGCVRVLLAKTRDGEKWRMEFRDRSACLIDSHSCEVTY